jgi:hypothetical protein
MANRQFPGSDVEYPGEMIKNAIEQKPLLGKRNIISVQSVK